MCVFIEIFQLKFTKRYLNFFLHFPFRETSEAVSFLKT